MPEFTGGEALVCSLQRQGIDVIFGIPGTHLTDVYGALLEHPEVRHILVRHEQSAAYMADGYARVSGRLAAALTVAGPGATNTMTAMAEAYSDSSPVLLVSSEIESEYIGKSKGLLHEIPGLLEAFRPVTKWRARAGSSGAIPESVAASVAAIKSGRPRPGYLQIPVDFLHGRAGGNIPEPQATGRAKGDAAQVAVAAELLRESQRPLIFAGGGVIQSGAGPELQQLAEALQAPVFFTTAGKGAIPDDHPLSMGAATYGSRHGGPDLLKQADMVLAIGTHFSDGDTGSWSLKMPENLVHVDIDPEEIGKNYTARIGIAGDAREVLRQILRFLGGWQRERNPQVEEDVAGYWEAKRARVRNSAEPALRAIDQIRAVLPRDAITVHDQTNVSYWSLSAFPVYEPRTFVFPMGLCTLGFALPVALGAKVAQPERDVLAVIGDGGFMIACQELATAVQDGINIVVILFNDGGYGAVKASQMRSLSGRHMATELVAPNFVQFARSFGAQAERVESIDELAPALTKALGNGVITVIEVPLPLLQPPWLT